MDNKPGLLLAATARTAHEVIEFLDQEFIRSKPLVSRVSFHYSANESPWQVGINGSEASQGTVGTVENLMPVGLVNVLPLLGTAPKLSGVKLIDGVVLP